jgi:hypothetical protein
MQASWGWLKSFMKRDLILQKTQSGESNCHNTEMLKYISDAENCLNEHIITNRKETIRQSLDMFVGGNIL